MKVVVAIEHDHPAPRPQDPEPFAVCLPGSLQVPYQVPREDEIEGLIGKGKVLGVHATECCVYAELLAVLPRLIKHGIGVVDGRDLVPLPAHDDGEEPRSGPDVQHPKRSPVREMSVNGIQPPVRSIGPQIVHDRAGISFDPHRPVILYGLELLHFSTLCSSDRSR